MRKKWAVALAILLIASSIAGNILYNKYLREDSYDRSRWPTTSGTVYAYKEEWWPNDRDTLVYVDYSYEVKGKEYSAQQSWALGFKTPKYSQGQIVTVYYHPTKPEMSVVEPRIVSLNQRLAWIWVALGGAVVTISAIIIVWLNRRQPW
jgi:hypothetical protein